MSVLFIFSRQVSCDVTQIIDMISLINLKISMLTFGYN